MLLFLACVLVAGAVAATAYRPWLAPLMLAIALPFDFPLEIGLTVYTTECLLAGMLLGWGAHWLCRRSWPAVSWRLWIWAAPFFTALLLSAVNAGAVGPVLKQTLRWLEFFLVLWLTHNTVSGEQEQGLLIRVAVAAAVAAALVGLVQSLAGPGSFLNYNQSTMMLYQDKWIRAYATLGHPNQLAGYLLCLLPLALALVPQGGEWNKKLLPWTAVGILSAALLLTYTRGAWISAAAAGGIWLYVKVPRRIFLLVLGIAGVVVVLLGAYYSLNPKRAPMMVQRLFSIATPGQEDSVHFRTVCTRTAVKMFRRHPWLGFGAGQYEQNIRGYFTEDYYAWEAICKHIHNLYLQILVETGIAGLAGFFLLLAAIGVRLLRGPGVFSLPAATAAVFGGLAFLLANMFDVLTIYARGMHFSLLLGIGLASLRFTEGKTGAAETQAA
ncbi:O-antigen ligase family protein [candidate division FCPU426 bacterium]|nr:O-antigen ligase family protein [candidate division FCPU426 bacterium]